MSEIVLGWCLPSARCPADVITHAFGPLRMITVPLATAPTPRALMRQQLACFEADVDLIPAAPRRMLGVVEALEMPQQLREEIFANVAQICGQGQLTLRLGAPARALPKSVRPSNWLRARQADRLAKEALSDDLAKVMRQLTQSLTLCAPITFDPHRHNSTCHCLVPRSVFLRVKDTISQRAASLAADPFCLDVTGLWPVYSLAPRDAPVKAEAVA